MNLITFGYFRVLILIDESGDTGFKKGSSRYFILTMVVFKTSDEFGRYPEAEHTSLTIENLKNEIGHKPEFHFSQCSQKIRLLFFDKLKKRGCNFQVFSLVVDKNKVYSHHIKGHTQGFYNFFLKQLITHNPINNAKVKIDGQKSKPFRQALKTYLTREKKDMLAKLKFSNSKNDYLVQLADMCCGAIAYKYNRRDKLESDQYVKKMSDKIVDIWEFQ